MGAHRRSAAPRPASLLSPRHFRYAASPRIGPRHRVRFPEGCMFSRLANLFKGFFSLFISGVERRNPEALLELEQENLRKQIAQLQPGPRHARRPVRAADGPGPQARSRAEGPARQDHRAPARRQQIGRRPVRAAPADHRARSSRRTASSWSRPKTPTRTWSRRATSRCRPRGEDREPEGRHQRHAHEPGHGRDPRDGGRHDLAASAAPATRSIACTRWSKKSAPRPPAARASPRTRST